MAVVSIVEPMWTGIQVGVRRGGSVSNFHQYTQSSAESVVAAYQEYVKRRKITGVEFDWDQRPNGYWVDYVYMHTDPLPSDSRKVGERIVPTERKFALEGCTDDFLDGAPTVINIKPFRRSDKSIPCAMPQETAIEKGWNTYCHNVALFLSDIGYIQLM